MLRINDLEFSDPSLNVQFTPFPLRIDLLMKSGHGSIGILRAWTEVEIIADLSVESVGKDNEGALKFKGINTGTSRLHEEWVVDGDTLTKLLEPHKMTAIYGNGSASQHHIFPKQRQNTF